MIKNVPSNSHVRQLSNCFRSTGFSIELVLCFIFLPLSFLFFSSLERVINDLLIALTVFFRIFAKPGTHFFFRGSWIQFNKTFNCFFCTHRRIFCRCISWSTKNTGNKQRDYAGGHEERCFLHESSKVKYLCNL